MATRLQVTGKIICINFHSFVYRILTAMEIKSLISDKEYNYPVITDINTTIICYLAVSCSGV